MSGPSSLFRRPRGMRRGAGLTLLFASVLAAGAATGSFGSEPHEPAEAPPRSTPVAQDVSEAAAEAMADGKSPTDAAREAVSRSGDRWGKVYDEEEFEEFEQSLDGEYTGVGLWARRAGSGRIEVAAVQHGGPAERAGITAGDRLRSIDGQRLDGRPTADVVRLLRGGEGAGPGSAVTLGLQRGKRTWEATLHRATLAKQTVTVRDFADGTRLVKVASFTKGSGAEVRKAVKSAPAGHGILLDLRGNSGGLVAEAVDAASAFLDGGLVATYDVRGEQRALHAIRGGETSRPLVVLVDGGTMSAAELLAGALQDRGRAVVVGSRTFGKGSVQMPTRLPDGSVAELTVGHYRTPSGRGVDGRGITPDLKADDDAESRARTVLGGLGPPS
ncbi:PDZ domain-containing protein [Streptomyces sp. TRM66268-LWL]|uniref:PDZ domain-containing protein n=1 Tax=Streptomyces polyasparticus TaxID=2767826 RepID=A0ABR7SRQ8_9ACTN|nr:S41 family peptidase [Streptomyces polyasparticus]MBC9718192.1 PDZ domain-containing protein [Streptomyces polyasparticus]